MHNNYLKGCIKFSDEQISILKGYGFMLHRIRCYFDEIGYLELRLPSIHIGNKNGQFNFNFFGKPARLSASNALYLNVYSMQLGCVYSIQRFFRAEKIITYKHLSEFDMLGVGIPDADLNMGMQTLENLIYSLIADIRCSQYSSLLNVNLHSNNKPFIRESYQSIAERFDVVVQSLDKFETEIAREIPVFVVGLPIKISTWTAEIMNDGQHTLSFNLLLPIVGEVAEGAQRVNNAKLLSEKFKAIGFDRQLGWYANSIINSKCRTVGFGVGLERLAMWLFGLRNIRQIHPIYRDTNFSEIVDGENQ